MTETKRRPLRLPELMRRDGRFAGRLLRVRGPFEERGTGVSSLC